MKATADAIKKRQAEAIQEQRNRQFRAAARVFEEEQRHAEHISEFKVVEAVERQILDTRNDKILQRQMEQMWGAEEVEAMGGYEAALQQTREGIRETRQLRDELAASSGLYLANGTSPTIGDLEYLLTRTPLVNEFGDPNSPFFATTGEELAEQIRQFQFMVDDPTTSDRDREGARTLLREINNAEIPRNHPLHYSNQVIEPLKEFDF